MSVVKINVLTVPAEMRETLEARFAARAGAVAGFDGFEWFELLRPVDGTDRYLVYTRWRSEQDFENWKSSQSFGQSHGGGGAPAHGGGAPAHGAAAPSGPAASGAELWSFEVLQSEGPQAG